MNDTQIQELAAKHGVTVNSVRRSGDVMYLIFNNNKRYVPVKIKPASILPLRVDLALKLIRRELATAG